MEYWKNKTKHGTSTAHQYAVIGLGNFGLSVATTLFGMGADVLAVDIDGDKIDAISKLVTHAVQADATDEDVLRTLGIHNFDTVVVAIRSSVQSSIIVTLLCKELGVTQVIAEAQSDIHAKALAKIGADKVLLPERDIGQRLAHNLTSSNILDFIELSSDYTLAEMKALPQWTGKSLNELNLRQRYGINVLAISENERMNVTPTADDKINEGDLLLVIGEAQRMNELSH